MSFSALAVATSQQHERPIDPQGLVYCKDGSLVMHRAYCQRQCRPATPIQLYMGQLEQSWIVESGQQWFRSGRLGRAFVAEWIRVEGRCRPFPAGLQSLQAGSADSGSLNRLGHTALVPGQGCWLPHAAAPSAALLTHGSD